MYRPTVKGYFSGCGGMELGLLKSGLSLIQSLDLDPEASACMSMNQQYFHHPVLTADIMDKTVLQQPKSDVIVGTYPCTKYSTAAEIHNTRTGDDLFLHFFRHIAIEQPEMYVVENVPGMKKFPVVMEAMTQLPQYYINVFCPVNASLWLPQDRKRLILIGTRKPFMIAAPGRSTKRVRIADIIEKDVVMNIKDHVLSRIEGGYRDKPIVVDPADSAAIAPCCVAHYAKDQGTRLVKVKGYPYDLRPFTIREYARLQGFPDDFIFPDKLSSYRLIGNAVPVSMGEWIGKEAMRYFN